MGSGLAALLLPREGRAPPSRTEPLSTWRDEPSSPAPCSSLVLVRCSRTRPVDACSCGWCPSPCCSRGALCRSGDKLRWRRVESPVPCFRVRVIALGGADFRLSANFGDACLIKAGADQSQTHKLNNNVGFARGRRQQPYLKRLSIIKIDREPDFREEYPPTFVLVYTDPLAFLPALLHPKMERMTFSPFRL